jgi:hypothetical protein
MQIALTAHDVQMNLDTAMQQISAQLERLLNPIQPKKAKNGSGPGNADINPPRGRSRNANNPAAGKSPSPRRSRSTSTTHKNPRSKQPADSRKTERSKSAQRSKPATAEDRVQQPRQSGRPPNTSKQKQKR